MGGINTGQLQGLAVTTDHQPPPSMEDQLCRGRVVVLQHSVYLFTGYIALGVSWVVQAKVSSHLCFAWGALSEL